MGSAWSSSEELPRNENGKRLRSWESTTSDDGDNDANKAGGESSYRETIMGPSSQHRVVLVREEETKIKRRTKRQRVQDYNPEPIRTTTYSVRQVPSSLSSQTPFLVSAAYNLTGKFCILLAQAYMSLTEYSVKLADAAASSNSKQKQEILQSVSEMLNDFQSLEPDILSRGWRILCACSIPSNDNNGLFDHLPDNDIGTVVTGMRLHQESLQLQMLGCRALKILLDSDRGSWEQLLQQGFVQVMMDAMKRFPTHLVLQGLMMSFLGMIIKENNDYYNNNSDNDEDGDVEDEDELLPRELLELGVIKVILAALHEFQDSTRFLHTGCLALLQMTACLPEAREQIVEQNGHILVYRILKAHLRDELLLIVSLNTLSKLLAVQTMEGLPMEDVVQTVLECMQLYPHEESVQTHALVSILRLGEHTLIPTEETIQRMIPAMMYFRHSRSLIFIACVVIRSLIAHSTQPAAVLQVLLDTGGIECIVNATKDHKSRNGIQQIVQLLLSVLLVHQHAIGVPAAFRGSLRVVGHMTSFENFDSDHEDNE